MTRKQDIADLSDRLRAIFVDADNEAARRISEGWHAAVSADRLPTPRNLPATAWLPQVVANAPVFTAGLVGAFAAVSDRLSWQQTYSRDDLGQHFLDRYGWVMLVGPDAPVKNSSILSGFLLLGPDVEYPVHKHAAEEVYVILSGSASWKIGDADWRLKSAGSIIHNPSWQPHGMRTDRREPLLIGFLWNADKVEKSQMAANDATMQT